eukprot:CAMPEP_0181251722 /NCGR_PEP_ID=MMETSP1096-20121128/47045_1 /TAXON_ID=156174 ORGANISM="Chrysochromulina ericina, Strain CCMP281" /NCGR_SAMPLE_ID=MMETSP1096 /ASSEMBLY_ACC=CAM_ASM_000453 /LENGTH=120 /DNA_ID=CAMNT_0023349357 /DNA_START=454 /DNA_END=817 /DNA_ORIENTATION=-
MKQRREALQQEPRLERKECADADTPCENGTRVQRHRHNQDHELHSVRDAGGWLRANPRAISRSDASDGHLGALAELHDDLRLFEDGMLGLTDRVPQGESTDRDGQQQAKTHSDAMRATGP